jgi:hypothetical protein
VVLGGSREARIVISQLWRRIHRWPRTVRWPLKLAVFAVVTGLVLYPKVWLLPAWVGRLRNLNTMVDPNCPELAGLEAEVRVAAGPQAPLERLAHALEHVVYEHVPYAYDWETWGVMDYIPTVAEVFAKGREDCDGRAVVAASLLRRMGHEAQLVTDLKHVWVVARDATAVGAPPVELMGPGAGDKTLAGGESGTRIQWNLATVGNLLRGLTFGIAVFPPLRELLIVLALCVVTLQPRSSWARRVAGCALLVGALVLLRAAGPATEAIAQRPILVWVGGVAGLGGWLMLVLKSRRKTV